MEYIYFYKRTTIKFYSLTYILKKSYSKLQTNLCYKCNIQYSILVNGIGGESLIKFLIRW